MQIELIDIQLQIRNLFYSLDISSIRDFNPRIEGIDMKLHIRNLPNFHDVVSASKQGKLA